MLVRVLEIPEPTGNFHFGGGQPQIFREVDWFQDDNTDDPSAPPLMQTEEGRQRVIKFVKAKRYFSPNKSYLLLHPTHSVTINYDAMRADERV